MNHPFHGITLAAMLAGTLLLSCTEETPSDQQTRSSAPVLSPGDGEITVTWEAVTDATAYEIWYGTANHDGSATQWGGDITDTDTVISGLENGTGYYVWLRSKTAEATSPFSASGYAIPRGAFIPQADAVWTTGTYRNLFAERGRSQADIDTRVNAVFNQLFYGSNTTQRIYYPVGTDMAYILDVNNNDVRSEGMSYGMMFCVQLDKQAEFDRLWNFAKTYMQHTSGPKTGYFRWQVRADGSEIDSNSAPDGEEYFAMALYFAWKRWGNGTGIYNYQAEADNILNHMINHRTLMGLAAGDGSSENMIALNNSTGRLSAKQIVFVPIYNNADFTDPSYHLPAFYEIWSLWAPRDNALWGEIADESRILFRNACYPSTGLAPDYSHFDGTPKTVSWGAHHTFRHDAWRVAMNITLDAVWWNADPWQKATWADSYLGFFNAQGVTSYNSLWQLNGTGGTDGHSAGLVAMNAVAALIWDDPRAGAFVDNLWNTAVPTGQYRYYDGCLYMFGMLIASGKYQIWGRG